MSVLYANEGTAGYDLKNVEVILSFGSLAHGIGYYAYSREPCELHEGSAVEVSNRKHFEWHDMWHGSGRKFCLLAEKHWCDLEDE